MKLIDADTLNYVRVRIYHDDGTIGGYNAVVPSSEIKNAPTVDAVPVEFIKSEIKNNKGFYNSSLRRLLDAWAERKDHELSLIHI